MNTLRTSASALALASTITAHAGDTPTLYGITAPDPGTGQLTLAIINTETGAAEPAFSFSLSRGIGAGPLAYHPPTDQLLLRAGAQIITDTTLVLIDPDTQTVTEHTYTNIPAGTVTISGLEYQPTSDTIYITYGFSSNLEDHIATIDLEGNILQSGVNLGLGDRDTLGHDQVSDQLLAFDFNGAPPGIHAVIDPFGDLSTPLIFSPPFNSDVGDVAIHPDTGTIYVAGFDAQGGDLVIAEPGGYTEVGPFNLAQIGGLAFRTAPPPSCPEDLNNDGSVNSPDLNILLAAFASTDAGDLNDDGQTNSQDLNILLAAFGDACPA